MCLLMYHAQPNCGGISNNFIEKCALGLNHLVVKAFFYNLSQNPKE